MLECATQTFVPYKHVQSKVIEEEILPVLKIKIEKTPRLHFIDQTPDFRNDIESQRSILEFTPRAEDGHVISFDQGIIESETIRLTKPENKFSEAIRELEPIMISTQQSDFKVEDSFSPKRLVKGGDGRVFKDIVIQTPTTPRMMCNLNQKFGRGFISP